MSNILNNFKKDFCCGCSACKFICPTKAISLVEDERGFEYPKINSKLCINCSLCEKVCDFKKFSPTGKKPLSFAARHKNMKEVATSRSGAFFIALAEMVVEKNGIVFGCEMTNKNIIMHTYYNDKIGINRFKGSKYVQSDIGDCFRRCAEFLEDDKMVLFSGTGCQIGGLISFLELKRINTMNLITLDIICHGTPSRKLWNSYVKEYELKNNDSIIEVNFRNKEKFGWSAHQESFLMKKGKINYNHSFSSFYNNSKFMDSCYNCKYTTTERKSDFTIGDCWGIEKVNSKFDDNKGVSLILVHNDKAKLIFEQIKDNLNFESINIDFVMQPQLKEPIIKNDKDYEKFWNLFIHNEKKCINKYYFPSILKVIIKKIKRKIKN